MAELRQHYEMHQAQITECRKQLLGRVGDFLLMLEKDSGVVDLNNLASKDQAASHLTTVFRTHANKIEIPDRQQIIDQLTCPLPAVPK